MSETHPIDEAFPTVESSVVFEIPSVKDSWDDGHWDESYGIPERLVPVVAKDLLAAVALRGYEPDRVGFCGYDLDDAEVTDADAQKLTRDTESNRAHIATLTAELLRRHDAGTLTDSRRQEILSDIALVRSVTSKKPIYFVAGLAELQATTDDSCNPIHYAATGPGAVIAVYNYDRLDKIDPDFARDGIRNLQIKATAQELQQATVLLYRPRYHYPEEVAED